MKSRIIIDTDILIDISREIINAIKRLKQEELNHQLSISIITKMELIIGCRNKREADKLNQFLQRFHLININNNISNQASELIECLLCLPLSLSPIFLLILLNLKI